MGGARIQHLGAKVVTAVSWGIVSLVAERGRSWRRRLDLCFRTTWLPLPPGLVRGAQDTATVLRRLRHHTHKLDPCRTPPAMSIKSLLFPPHPTTHPHSLFQLQRLQTPPRHPYKQVTPPLELPPHWRHPPVPLAPASAMSPSTVSSQQRLPLWVTSPSPKCHQARRVPKARRVAASLPPPCLPVTPGSGSTPPPQDMFHGPRPNHQLLILGRSCL